METHETTRIDALAEDLYTRIGGEIRFDPGSRALYATDASNYRQPPLGVVIPKTIQDVIETVAACRRADLPILSRGGGTSLAGQCCNAAVLMDMSKYLNKILEIDPEKRCARVQPGVVLDDLRDQAERHGLTFGPDPSTHNHCTLGGMIGNNSCGVHSVMAGKTMDNVESLDILTYQGDRMQVGGYSEAEIQALIQEGGAQGDIFARLRVLRDEYADEIRARMPRLPRRSSGFNLDQLLPENGFHVARALTGTEGSCVTILEATVRLVESPPSRVLVVLGYPDIFSTGDHVPEIMSFAPIGMEGMDDKLIGYERKKGMHAEDLPMLPDGKGWLLVEFGGRDRAEAEAKVQGMLTALAKHKGAPSSILYDDRDQEKKIWAIRESGLGATARIPGQKDTWPGWEDSSVPPEKVGAYLRELQRLFGKFGYDGALYGHFGQGCIHTRINFDLKSRQGIDHFRAFLDEAADAVVAMGGSLSGEHGDGQARAELLPKMYGERLVQAFREFKAIWDPRNRMNPGKAIDAYPITSNLRLGADYNPQQPETHFHYLEDDGSLGRATLRCVGVGECRRLEKETMCPSYRVTKEEKHSTRGRARMLFEMLQGDVIKDGMKSEEVKESLDLCLSCKGCKHDCPVNVDMATYKAEFLAGYYKGRLRPVSAYATGLIYWAARAASLAPGLANTLLHAPILGRIFKRAGGFALERNMPSFASETFKSWHGRRAGQTVSTADDFGDAGHASERTVVLWPDTFNNHFHPEALAAALDVLEGAGFRVLVPARPLCCGRPLYDSGMLDLAKRQLRQILDALRPAIQAGIPVVGLEPSCISVFRDEMPNLLAGDEDALRLSKQAFLFEEFLMAEGRGFKAPRLGRKVLLHGHCHQKAVLKMEPQYALLKAIQVEWSEPESGCCGMAGSFGFERDKYSVSIAIGERHFLPALRSMEDETLIIANGFSCQQQVKSVPGRKPMHIAEAVHFAAKGAEAHREFEQIFPAARLEGWVKGLLMTSLFVMGLAWVWSLRNPRHRKLG